MTYKQFRDCIDIYLDRRANLGPKISAFMDDDEEVAMFTEVRDGLNLLTEEELEQEIDFERIKTQKTV